MQALTQEAAILVKQAVNLATSRGHSHVSPLHLAIVMLSNPTTLNRLSSSTISSYLLGGPQYSSPSLSNSLVSAFKHAQGHERRANSIENQQHSILALKIEVEQLIISILVSSTVVKIKVEQALKCHSKRRNTVIVSSSRSFDQLGGPINHVIIDVDDASNILSQLVRKRRNTVIVGDSVANVKEVARRVMQRLERGNVEEQLRYIHFVSVPLVSFKNISKEEAERKIVELRRLIRSYVGRGFILYLGDLKWLFQSWREYFAYKFATMARNLQEGESSNNRQ